MSVTEGDTIHVHYTGILTDATQFNSSEGRDPLEFCVGSGMLIPYSTTVFSRWTSAKPTPSKFPPWMATAKNPKT